MGVLCRDMKFLFKCSTHPANISRQFPDISENFRRLPKKIRRFFDYIYTNKFKFILLLKRITHVIKCDVMDIITPKIIVIL